MSSPESVFDLAGVHRRVHIDILVVHVGIDVRFNHVFNEVERCGADGYTEFGVLDGLDEDDEHDEHIEDDEQ